MSQKFYMFDPDKSKRIAKPVGNKGAYTLRVSNLKIDWPGNWQSEAQLTAFANGYIKHAIRYLSALGYYPVHVTLCDGYIALGGFDWNNDPQRDMRNEIMADYLNPQKPKTHDLNYLSSALDSPK